MLIFNVIKNKIFNKNKYSKIRQTSRVIFWISIIINLIVLFLIYSVFYSVLIKITYIWWFFFILISTIIIPSSFKLLKQKII